MLLWNVKLLRNGSMRNWYETVRKDDIWIDSPNGYLLRAVFLKPLETARTVIICHGVTENKINSMKYARLFERLGFNSVIYDHRRHGDSGGKTTSFGYYEKLICKRLSRPYGNELANEHCLVFTANRWAPQRRFYMRVHLRMKPIFILSIAHFPISLNKFFIFYEKIRLYEVTMALRIANLFLKMRDGYTLNLVSPREVVENIKNPCFSSTVWKMILSFPI